MHQNSNYVVQSLELHLFLARIIKEHALFLRAGLTPIDMAFAKEAEFYKREFEKVLFRAVSLGNGVVTRTTLHSGGFFTEFTAQAESQTERLTGIPINGR